jgi:photosystem II stability/assembly factor-like uncharacterized protein
MKKASAHLFVSTFAAIGLFLLITTPMGCRNPAAPISGHWQQVAQLPQDVYYNKILFTTTSSGWVIGNSGKLLHTSDAGANWQVIQSGSTRDFHSIAFVGEQNGWIGGEGAVILHTTDGGVTWSQQPTLRDTSRRFLSMCFVNAQTGWVVSNYGEILHTTDSGNVWSFQTSTGQLALVAVDFVNTLCGWACTPTHTILRTTDGGTHWDTTDCSATMSSSWSTDIRFADEQRGWIATTVSLSSSIQTGAPVFHTNDGGKTWIRQVLLPTTDLLSIAVVSPELVWVAGFSQIFYTSDGGNAWNSEYAGDGNVYVGLSFADAGHGWALGISGQVLRFE